MDSDLRLVIPLESNPDIFNGLAHKLGLVPIVGFHDIYSLTDPDLLSLLPQPVYGVLLLFPLGIKYEQDRIEQDSLKQAYENQDSSQIVWFKQTIGNGCGLYALLHLLSNLPPGLLVRGLSCDKLVQTIKSETPPVAEISHLVEQLAQSVRLDDEFGLQGQTEAPAADSEVDLHFIAFIKGKNNHLYELDGRRNGPIDLGDTASPDPNILFEPSLAKKIQAYMNGADDESKNRFALMCIAPMME